MNTLRRTVLCTWLLTLPACGLFGLDQEQRAKLAQHQANAKYYYGGKRYDQAMSQIRKGLEIQPDDYQLTSLRGKILMITSDQTPQNLDRAAVVFSDLQSMRDLDDHQPHALLGIGECQQRLGLRHWRQAALLETEAEGRDLTDAERENYTEQANEHEVQANFHWNEAERMFKALLLREELIRIAAKHLMEIYVERNDYERALEFAEACLQRNAEEQKVKRSIIKETLDLGWEREKRQELHDLIEQEKRVRTALAEMHYRRENFELAAEQLGVLLELDPTRSNDYYNRARAYEAMSRGDDARRDYEKFLAATKLPASDKRVLHAVQFTQSR